MDGVVYSVGVWNGNLIAGGDFFNAGGQSAQSIAQWQNCPTAVDGVGPVIASGVEFRGLYAPSSRGAFELALPASASARLTVVDVTGRVVGRWNSSASGEGRRLLPLEFIAGRSLPGGVYFGRAEVTAGADGSVLTGRTVHVR
jgi:hypothetical protein